MKKETEIQAYAMISLVITFLLFVVFMNSGINYSDFKAASCMPTHCFCEQVNNESNIRQFANTFSSFTFVYVGFYILFHSLENQLRLLLLGLFAIFIGLGSAFFHATLTFLGQIFDLLGMYLLSSFMLLFALYRLVKLTVGETMVLLIALNTILLLGLIVAPELRRYLFVLLLISAIVLEVYFIQQTEGMHTTKITLAIYSLLIACVVWILDIQKVMCDPSNIVQGHALWHTLCALAIYFMYRHYEQGVE